MCSQNLQIIRVLSADEQHSGLALSSAHQLHLAVQNIKLQLQQDINWFCIPLAHCTEQRSALCQHLQECKRKLKMHPF